MGSLQFENRIKSIDIILDVIYLMSTALGQRDFEGSFIDSKNLARWLMVMLLYSKAKRTLWLTEKWLSTIEAFKSHANIR